MRIEDWPQGFEPVDNSWVELVGEERFAPYLEASHQDHGMAAQLYVWNIRAAGSLLELIGILEIFLRNSMVTALRTIGDESEPHWFMRHWEIFSPQAKQTIETGQIRAHGEDGRFLDSRLIAELPFGFWVNLLARRYEMPLWRRGLHEAFANVQSGRRSDVYVQLEYLRILRNRVAHHEPIHRRDLLNEQQRILLVLRWISPEASRWAASVSRVEIVASDKPVA